MSPVRILIVEDELLIARGLARKLSKMGYDVVDVVASGVRALHCIVEKQPDLVLMDIVIKGDLDGIETADRIHSAFNLPVIYLTAYADDQTLDRAEKTGSYGYILKPFKERELHAAIKLALQKHQESLLAQQSIAAVSALSTEKSRQLTIAAHDLRNPLSTIQLSTGMLQEFDALLPADKKAEYFERIQNAIETIDELLEDVLTLSKAESGSVQFAPAPLDIVPFCQALLRQLQANARPEHQIVFLMPDGIENSGSVDGLVNVDERLLRYILSNLLSNAVKYSPLGGTIQLDLTIAADRVTLSISDQGIGIPLDYHPHLFQRFQRAPNVGDIRGTGLGLSIVKQAVDLHQGTIDVESDVEVGTRFTVVLPCPPIADEASTQI